MVFYPRGDAIALETGWPFGGERLDQRTLLGSLTVSPSQTLDVLVALGIGSAGGEELISR